MGAIEDSPHDEAVLPRSIAAEQAAEPFGDDAWVRRSGQISKPAHPPLAAAILMISVVLLLVAAGLVSAL